MNKSSHKTIPGPIQIVHSDYSNMEHLYIIILELTLDQLTISMVFASLALTKMNCQRIANYLLLPVFSGLLYWSLAAYQSPNDNSQTENSIMNEITSGTNDSFTTELAANQNPAAQSIELAAERVPPLLGLIDSAVHNTLALMALVQLLANMSSLGAFTSAPCSLRTLN